MSVKEIKLSWFRGAASNITLETASKSVVVYGDNGAGKSSFVDAVEYLATGKVGHLAHEYSGSRQEKGIRNTHAPAGVNSEIQIVFHDNTSVGASISPTGHPSFSSKPSPLMAVFQGWDKQGLLLRQDEVAKFVHDSKGDKYSSLLPLLGLESWEAAAKHFASLHQKTAVKAKTEAKRYELQATVESTSIHFDALTEDAVYEKLLSIATVYLNGDIPSISLELAKKLSQAIEIRSNSIEPELKRQHLISQLDGERLQEKLIAVKSSQIVGISDIELLDKHLAVLNSAKQFVSAAPAGTEEVDCPACGRLIRPEELTAHIEQKLEEMKSEQEARVKARSARRALAQALRQILQKSKDPLLSDWIKAPEQSAFQDSLTALANVDLEDWQESSSGAIPVLLTVYLPVIATHLAAAANSAQPSVANLVSHKEVVDAALLIPKVNALKLEVEQVAMLLQVLEQSEDAIRDEIRTRTKAVITRISAEAQQLWAKLHPDEPIEDIHLHIPNDADKAIDIGLKFYGIDQPSPRLTLSEGHRNSLGLCIFLALSRTNEDKSHPIFLDDIVSSLDRHHRGMLADILRQDLSTRQVFLFTHDREWFAELRTVLPDHQWNFISLSPWDSPRIGIRQPRMTSDFEEARSLLAQYPEAACNATRGIMDVKMAFIAEKLQLSLPYLRGAQNDHRTCIEFLARLIAEAKRRLKKKQGNELAVWEAAVADLTETWNLLKAWANPGSHGKIVTGQEAKKLIEVCERAMSYFRCGDCKVPIWAAKLTTPQHLQCQCGNIRWQYS